VSEPIKPGSPAAVIITEEEDLLARVQARASTAPDDIEDRVGAEEFDRELVELRDAIAEAKPEDLPPLVEQMTRLSAIRGRLGGSRVLPIDVSSPYFAHLGLSEEGRQRDVLIGKRGFIDRQAGVQIVDWRNAPISQVYYRYDEGDDFEEEVEGRTFVGLVLVRRNLSIRSSRLRRIGAPQGTFVRDAHGAWHEAVGSAAPVLRGGQGKAARAPQRTAAQPARAHRGGGPSRLGVHHGPTHRADKHLPEIAALIDREQFDLITQPESGMVVIQGGAGSGKTTVALHRIAFLAFADASRFKPRDMLFVVPTQSLARYVADVLPSLGVSGVPVVTYGAWAKSTRLRLLRDASNKYNDETPDAVARIKKHPLLLAALEKFVADQANSARRELAALDARAATCFDEAQARGLVPRLRTVKRWLGGPGSDLLGAHRVAAESALKRLITRAGDVLADWAELLTDRGRLQPLVSAGVATRHELDQLLAWVSAQEAAAEPVPRGPDGGEIESVDGLALDEGAPNSRFDVEDDPILLRFIQLKRGGLVGPETSAVGYQHIAIDEAQDRSALEVKVLLDATKPGPDGNRSVTIAGDTAQRLVFDNGFSGWEDLLTRVGENAAVVRPLRLSYRSTAEVMQLSREVLGPELAPEEPLAARSGAPVELHAFGDIGAAVAFLGDALRALVGREPSASVAVIARYPEQADSYYAGLARAEVPSLRRVRQHDFSFTAGVDVTDVSQVKGLEFDYVIMIEVNATTYNVSVESRHLLHIGMTRAAHQLWLIATAEPSLLLPEPLRAGALGPSVI
jgi:DNA helicase-2/ATP-dependent DNA helicase PcrA